MTKRTKYDIGILATLASAAIVITLWGNRQKSDVNKNRVIVLSYVFKVAEAEVGKQYKCYYFYEEKKYINTISFVGEPKLEVGSLLFTEISSKNPNNANILYRITVPYCITLDSMPAKGWKEIPTCDSIGTLP